MTVGTAGEKAAEERHMKTYMIFDTTTFALAHTLIRLVGPQPGSRTPAVAATR